jgi:hypothetical protein
MADEPAKITRSAGKPGEAGYPGRDPHGGTGGAGGTGGTGGPGGGTGGAGGVGGPGGNRLFSSPRSLRNFLAGIMVGFLVLGGSSMWGFVRDERADDRLEQLVEGDERQAELDAAGQCVVAWEVRQQIRASDEAHGLAAGEALLEVASARDEPPDPAVVAAYRDALRRHLTSSEADPIEDPACDLAAARRKLDEANTEENQP